MAMKTIETTLPWSSTRVAVRDDVRENWAARLGANARFLPRRIRLFADLPIRPSSLDDFLSRASAFLVKEMTVRSARVYRMSRTTGLAASELEEFLTAQRHGQGWAIYYTQEGGLPLPEVVSASEGGVIPCSSMQNHGVGWRRAADSIETWLVTARKHGSDWDLDSDVGHESAHAAFAPVPLFISPGVMENVPLSLADVDTIGDLEPEHIIRLLYFYSEIVVVAVRGEARRTSTRLPIADPEELYRLVAISEELFPGFGFEKAKVACARTRAYLDPKESDAIFDLATPIMRLLPLLGVFVNALAPPTLETLADAVKSRLLKA